MEYRAQLHQLHPELNAPEIKGWQFALNRTMYAIIWAPPDFMQYSPTQRVKEQTDISFATWIAAVLHLLVYRALPISAVGLLVFQKREF